MELDDIVRLSMTGRDVDQNEIVFTDRDRPISESNLARRPLTITFLEEQIKPLIGGVIVLSYQVARKGVWQSSPVKVISIGPSLAGLPPFINEVKDGRLDPGLIAQSIDVHIPSAGTRVGDRITLYWNDSSRKRPFRDKATVTQLNVDGDLSFDVYVDEVIQFNRGKIVTLFYTIERGSEGVARRPTGPAITGFLSEASRSSVLRALQSLWPPKSVVSVQVPLILRWSMRELA